MSKLYIKDGVITLAPKYLHLNGSTYCPPTADQLAAAGYVEYTQAVTEYTRTQADVDADRRLAYQSESDSYYIAYQAYLAEGLTEKAEEAKATWLAKRAEIQERYPSVEA